jgi:hypothetical protein
MKPFKILSRTKETAEANLNYQTHASNLGDEWPGPPLKDDASKD